MQASWLLQWNASEELDWDALYNAVPVLVAKQPALRICCHAQWEYQEFANSNASQVRVGVPISDSVQALPKFSEL